MNKKITVSIFFGIVVVVLMLLVYPFRLWNGIQLDQYEEAAKTEVLRLSERFSVKQRFQAQQKKLQAIYIALENIHDPAENGYLTVSLLDEAENVLQEQHVSYRQFENGKLSKIKTEYLCEENKDYVIKLIPCAGTYADIRIVSHSKNAPSSSDTYEYRGKRKSGGLAMHYQYEKYFRKIQVLMIWMVCFAVYMTFILLWNSRRSRDAVMAAVNKRQTWEQILVILVLVSAFQFHAYISPAVTVKKTLRVMMPSLILWIITVSMIYRLYRTVNWKETVIKLKGFLLREKFVCAVLAVSAFIRLLMFDTMPKWDAGEYYYSLSNACRNYQFTFQSFFENFRLCTHSNLGFSFMMGIAEFLSPGNPKGVYLWNLILTLYALYCLYMLGLKHWLKSSRPCAAIVTLAVSVTPLFLGTFAYVNVDYTLALFFIFVVYYESERKYLLMAFSTLILSQIKETGVVVVAGYFGMKILLDFWQEKGGILKKFCGCLHKVYMWIAMWAAVVYGLQIIRLGGFTEWQNQADDGISSMQWSDSGIHYFGFQPEYIVYKLKQFFILNFAWLLVILLTVCLVVMILRRITAKKKICCPAVLPMTGVMSALALFGSMYVTYTLSRYNILFAMLLSVITLCMLYYAIEGWRSRRLFYSITGVLCVLMCIQSFWNIDVVSKKTFQDVPIGKDHTMLLSSYRLEYFGDGLVTNYQYHWLDQAYDKMLDDIDYDPKQGLILTRSQALGTQINGNPPAYEVEWDPVRRKRVIRNADGSHRKSVNITPVSSMFSQIPFQYYVYETKDAIKPESYFINVPLYQEDEKAYLKMYEAYCYAAQAQRAGAYGGEIIYYPLIKKDEYCYISLGDLKDALSDQHREKNVKEKDWNQIFYQYLCEEGWSRKKVSEYYDYRLNNSGKRYELEDAGSTIHKMDIIDMELEVYDAENKKLSTEFVGNVFNHKYSNIVVGTGCLLKEADQALTGAEIGKTVETDVQIPEDYPALGRYAGQRMHFVIRPLKITGKIEYKEEDQDKLYSNSTDIVWNYYRDLAMKRLLLETVSSDFDYDQTLLTCEQKAIDEYFDMYFLNCGITEEEFLRKYLKVSREEYKTLKMMLAQAAIRAEQIHAVDEYDMYQFYKKGKDGCYQGNGFYSDGWMSSDTADLFVVNTKNKENVSMKYYANAQMDGAVVSIWKDHRCIGQQNMKEGLNEIVWKLGEDVNGKYEIKVSASFNPAKEGSGEDQRDLSILVQSITISNQADRYKQ